MTFRVKVGQGNRLSNRGMYPDELGVVIMLKIPSLSISFCVLGKLNFEYLLTTFVHCKECISFNYANNAQ